MIEFKEGKEYKLLSWDGCSADLKVGNTYKARNDTHFIDDIGDIRPFDIGRWSIVTEYPNPPHKHAELIKAWADGAEMQFYGTLSEAWISCNDQPPEWDGEHDLRIKPTNPNQDKIEGIKLKLDEARELMDGLKDQLDELEK